MRVALISLQSHADSPGDGLRGGLVFAGKSIVRRQFEFALEMGCEKLACLAEGPGAELREVRNWAEEAGVEFYAIGGVRQMLGIASATDEVLVLADGLLPLSREARGLLENGPGILSLPAAIACPEGFERIDAESAWAGAALIPAFLLERLSELPHDFDPVSALLRVGLQSHIRLKPLDKNEFKEGHWVIGSDAVALERLEQAWVGRFMPRAGLATPGRSAAAWTARLLSGHVLKARKLPLYLQAFGLILGCAGVGAAFLGWQIAGFLLVALGWLSAEAGEGAKAILREGAAVDGRDLKLGMFLSAAFDLALATVIFAVIAQGMEMRLFLSVLPILSSHLLAGQDLPKWSNLLQDRLVLCVIFALALLGGLLVPAIQLHLIGSILLVCLTSHRKSKLTGA